ncbi:MAG: hypothetical protein JWQ54_3179 [Mucilaginibacter sp.]|nr:hypothetical protein [Mucilaginibacter sp.]
MLIRKYLNGELDDRAMHQLEKRAQDDPFLMDALEGYENAQADQKVNLDELSGRLQQRITPKQRRIIPYRTLAIAASVLIVFTMGWLWLSNDHKQTPRTSAKVVKPVAKPPLAIPTPAVADTTINNQIAANTAPAPEKFPKTTLRTRPLREIIIADKKTEADNMIASAPPVAAKADTVDGDTTPLNEMVVMDYTSKQKKDTKENLQAAEVSKLKNPTPATTEQAVQSQVAGVTKTPAGSPFSAQSSKIILQGRIVDKTDGTALPGVSIRVPGTAFGAVTDNNGKFSIPVDSNKSSIVIAYIGYNTLKINARNRDSLKTIGLQPNNQSLNEVVVTTSRPKDESSDMLAVIAAHPREGWHSFKKYLSDNALSPDGKTGTITLSFMVDRNGDISEVTVIKGLSTFTNKKAIDLINNGPDWVGSTSGQTEQVKIRVKFAK